MTIQGASHTLIVEPRPWDIMDYPEPDERDDSSDESDTEPDPDPDPDPVQPELVITPVKSNMHI
jgi:hypothetical protein